MNKQFFITGLSRSGTTLLEKVLHNHPRLHVSAQPFPFLYRRAKQSFFNAIGYRQTYYVLNDLFKEQKYRPSDLTAFLLNFRFNKQEILKVFNEMKGYSGQLTKTFDLTHLFDSYQDGTFAETFSFLLDQIPKKKSQVIGGAKEINCEEFIGYFLHLGFKCIVIIRDPRDVITSLNIGKGTNYGGQHRPTLFHLRNWRKSVDLSLLFKDDPNFLVVKYENLVANPLAELNTIAAFLSTDPFPEDIVARDILDQEGNIWRNNSSIEHDNGMPVFNKHSVGHYRKYLDPDMIRYIEVTGFPEMKYLGYVDVMPNIAIDQFREQFPIKTSDIDPHFSTTTENIKDEKMRLNLYFEACSSPGSVHHDVASLFFIDDRVLTKLSEASSRIVNHS